MTAIAACRTCGTEPLEKARFCHGCGSPLDEADTRAEYKQVTVLFADVVHSMDIAAAVGAERLREIMAELVDRAAAVVQRYGGTVDKFTGDGIMAVFGAPVALEDHAVRACLAALGIQEETARLAAEVNDRDGVDLQLRVGLNSGQVIAGEIGSGALGYTAIGEQVGMAQRMESVAPPGGVMLSASTARLVDGAADSRRARSWFRSRVPTSRCPPVGCWAWATGIALSGVLSRIWSVGAGRCPPSKACWTAQSTATARWSAWSGHLASVRAVWCARWRRWRVGVAWRCSRPSASRTPAKSPSMPSHGCCAQPSASRGLTGRPLGIECATAFPTQTLRTWCSSMTCWASPIPMRRCRRSTRMPVGGG